MRSLAIIAAVGALALAACTPASTSTSVQSSTSAAPDHTLTPAHLPAFFDCLRAHSQTIVEAHRGGNEPGYAENAIETFAHTLAQEPAIIEIDIAKTKDGALVLMHDDSVDRTTNGHGAVADLTLDEIRALRLKDDDGVLLDGHPPTLREALEWADGKTILALDIKPSVTYEEVVSVVRTAHLENRIIFITYTNAQAALAHRLNPDMMISVSVNRASNIAALEHLGLDDAHMLAWTEIGEPNSALNIALAQHGIEAMIGTLGDEHSWDARFAREHSNQYAAFADTGLQIIGTDRAQAAAADLDAHDNFDGYGPSQCMSAS